MAASSSDQPPAEVLCPYDELQASCLAARYLSLCLQQLLIMLVCLCLAWMRSVYTHVFIFLNVAKCEKVWMQRNCKPIWELFWGSMASNLESGQLMEARSACPERNTLAKFSNSSSNVLWLMYFCVHFFHYGQPTNHNKQSIHGRRLCNYIRISGPENSDE